MLSIDQLLTILKDATNRLPQLRYAWGLLGISSIAALIIRILGANKASIVVIALTLIGVVLVFVATIAFGRDALAKRPAQVLIWSITIFFVIFLGFTISAFATSQPCNWTRFLDIPSNECGLIYPTPLPSPLPIIPKNNVPLLNHPQKELNIVVVMSESQPYELLIVNSFLERLRSKVKIQNRIIPRQLKNFISPTTEEGDKKWKVFINNIYATYAGQHVDYVVTVGTFASIAVKKFNLVKELDAKGLIFLGVTDPVRAKLVKSIDGRHEESEVAGSRYGSGGIDYGKTLGSLFRTEQKLVFVYDKRTPQDTYVASDITYLKETNGDNRFELRGLERPVESGDLGDPNSPNDTHEIYFAWYGLDDILSDIGGIEILKEKRVIPSTYSPEILQAAGIVVSVDDQKVGELGADILLKNYLDANKKLGDEPVAMPPFKIWTDCDTINRKGIKLMSGYC